MTEIKLAVVGLRNIGAGHARRARELADVEVVALAETDVTRLHSVGDELGVAGSHRFTDAHALFENSGVDAVVLAVPNPLHASLAIAALDAGLHVMVEKPMAISVGQCRDMIAARDRSGKHLLVGYQERFTPRAYGLRKQLRDGVIGPIQYAKTRYTRRFLLNAVWGRGDWFLDPTKAGGGPLIDLGVHRLDQTMFFLGYPTVKSVSGAVGHGIGAKIGQARGKDYRIEDFANGMICFEHGASLYLESSYFLNQRPEQLLETEIFGLKGGVSMPTGKPAELFITDNNRLEEVAIVDDLSAPRSSVEHLQNVLLGREEPCATAEQSLVVAQIVEAIYTSAAKGTAIPFPDQQDGQSSAR